MEHNTNPSKRPSRWARLKEQARQARAEAEQATEQKAWANVFITTQGLWQEFELWASQQPTAAKPVDGLCKYVEQIRQQADSTAQRLNTTSMVAKMYEEQKQGYYDLLTIEESTTKKLTSMVYDLTEKVVEQSQEIDRLKKELEQATEPSE